MNKKLISLLLAICLVIGLLPVMSIADTSEAATAKVAITKTSTDYIMEVTEGGEPVYGKSVAFVGTTSNGTYDGYEFTKTGASSTDWNFKLEYPLDGTPTLTLKDAKLINMDASGNAMKKDGTSTGTWTAIQSRNLTHPLKVVLQGENEIQADGFMRAFSSDSNKFSSVTVVSEDGGSLTGTVKSRGIQSKNNANTTDVSITIENADITLTSIGASAGYNLIYTDNGNITIKNSTLNLTATKGTLSAIHANGTGVISVENSQLELTSTSTAFNKAPTLSAGATIVAGDDAASAVAADAAALATAKYAKVTYPAPDTTDSTSAPTEATDAPTDSTSAPTEATGAALDAAYALELSTGSGKLALSLTNYDTPVYAKNTTKSGTFAANAADQYDYTAQAAGSEDDWNAKLIWHTGDEGPTLYLDGFRIDTYNETVGNYVYRTASAQSYYAAIYTGDTASLNIVLTGEDSYIRSFTGITYRNQLTIESDGDTKLTMIGRTGIGPRNTNGALYATGNADISGYKLILDANMDITVQHAGYWNHGILTTVGADMIINGGNINLTTTVAGRILMRTITSGNIVVNGGNVNAGGNPYRGVIVASGQNVYVNGGSFAAYGSFHAVYASNSTSAGNSEVMAPVLPEGGSYKLYQGTSSSTATEVTTLNASAQYMKVEILSGAPSGESTSTSAPTEATDAPTETTGAPSETTEAPTDTTDAPSSAPTTAPTVGMTAPAATTTLPTTPATPATSGTVTLWGTAVTVDETNTAYYWVNGAAGELPVATTDTNNWNYSFTIVDGIPTVTLKNANYTGTATFLSATYDGNLKVAYEGTNNIVVPYVAGSTARYFVNYKSSSTSAGRGHLLLAGADDATLNVTGGDNSAAMLAVSNKAYLTIYGGTINMEKGDVGGSSGVISAAYSKTVIQDCTLNVKHTNAGGDKHPAVTIGSSASSATVTITNANVSVETNAHTGICAGVFQSNMNGVVYVATMTVDGNSNIKVTTNTAEARDDVYSGVGIYASKLTVKSGNLEVEGNKKAVHLSSADAIPDLSAYNGQYEMFTEKGGAAVTAYTATTYFKVAYTGAPVPTAPTAPSAPSTPGSSGTTGATASTAKPSDYTLKLQGTNYRLSDYDTPVYLRNETKSGYYNITKTINVTDPTTGVAVTDPTTGAVKTQTVVDVSHTKDYAGQTTAEANESNYNAKLVWHTGDNGPTLYLRNFVIDEYNEELSKWRYNTATTTSTLTNAGMHTDKDAPLKIVVESGENLMKAYAGLQYQNDLTIESVGDATLTLWTNNVGIVPSSVGSQYVNNGLLSGNNLTLNANLTLSQGGWASANHSGHLIRVVGADLTINGGKIVTEYRGTTGRSVRGVSIQNSGNLYVNGGYIYSESYNAANRTEGAIEVAGDIYISGGTVDAVSGSQSGLVATNIYITGGTVKTRVNYAPLLVRAETGVISFTGGVIDLQGEKAPFINLSADKKSHTVKTPVLSTTGTLQGWVGSNPYVTTAYTDDYNKIYVKLGYEPIEANEMPVPVPGGEIPLKTTVTIGGNGSSSITLELKKYDEDVLYTVNKAVESVDADGNPYTRWIQTTEGADETNWNTKFVWHSTDSAPTLYLDGFKFDYWNEETGKFDATPSASTPSNNTAINTGSSVPMIIKLTGEDSMIEARFGIHYNNHLTILSDGDTKLTMNNQSSNVSSINASGFTLTVDANLELSIRSLYNSTYSGGALMNKGDIIVNGGTIVTTNEVENGKDVNGIVARDGGSLTINGGNITAVGANAQGHRNGALQSDGVLTINGGVVNLTAKKAVGMNGKAGVEINGGEINIVAPWYGITSGYSQRDENQKMHYYLEPISINGGTLTVMAERSFFGGTEVTIGEGVMAYAGAGKRNAEIYDGTETNLISKPWFFATDDESKFLVFEEEEEGDDDSIITLPTAPTTADGTAAPTDPTGADSSTEATVAPDDGTSGEAPEDEIPEEEWYHSNIYVDYIEGDMEFIPDALYDIGLDTVDAIWETMLENMWWVDEYIDRVSFFDAIPWYYDGEQWIIAEESHLPEDGLITMMLPYPEGTDMDTQFTALHMFTTDTFGMTPGEVELVYSENTEDGIYLELNGLSPVMLGWVDANAEDEPPLTGDADVAVFFTLMLLSVLGMAATVVLGKKRAV